MESPLDQSNDPGYNSIIQTSSYSLNTLSKSQQTLANNGAHETLADINKLSMITDSDVHDIFADDEIANRFNQLVVEE